MEHNIPVQFMSNIHDFEIRNSTKPQVKFRVGGEESGKGKKGR